MYAYMCMYVCMYLCIYIYTHIGCAQTRESCPWAPAQGQADACALFKESTTVLLYSGFLWAKLPAQGIVAFYERIVAFYEYIYEYIFMSI